MTDAPERLNGVEIIAAERQRQIDQEGWTPEHDDTHINGEIARAAGVYALLAGLRPDALYGRAYDFQTKFDRDCQAIQMHFPWRGWFKPKNRRADLVRAGALIAAEIDRLDRLAEREDI